MAGERYALMVIVREHSMDGAKAVARRAISRAGWQFPEVKEAMQIDGKMKMSKLRKLDLEEPVRSAAKHGCSIVVFDRM